MGHRRVTYGGSQEPHRGGAVLAGARAIRLTSQSCDPRSIRQAKGLWLADRTASWGKAWEPHPLVQTRGHTYVNSSGHSSPANRLKERCCPWFDKLTMRFKPLKTLSLSLILSLSKTSS